MVVLAYFDYSDVGLVQPMLQAVVNGQRHAPVFDGVSEQASSG